MPQLVRIGWPRWFATSFVLAFLATLAFSWATYAPIPPRVNVRWVEGLSRAQRAALESAYHLTGPENTDDRTWSYGLLDTSTANIRRLVQDRAAEDTYLIDRTTFTLTDPPPSLLVVLWRFSAWSAPVGFLVALLVVGGVTLERRTRSGREAFLAARRAAAPDLLPSPGLPEGTGRSSRMSRDNRIDTLRGTMLVVMTIDHLGGWVSHYTSEWLGYVSALEGFVFLSGFMFAIVYAGNLETPRHLLKRVALRALTIYRYQLMLLLSLLILITTKFYRDALEHTLAPYTSGTASYLVRGMLLLHQPAYLDILPLYVLFVIVSPLILLAWHRGWTTTVLVTSIALWLVGQESQPFSDAASLVCVDCRQIPEHVLAWQLMWVAGLYAGYRYRTDRAIILDRNPHVLDACVAVVILLFLQRHSFINLGFDTDPASDRVRLAWLRLLDFFAIAVVLVAILRRLPRHAGLPWLAFLGRYSLQVFTFHVVLSYLLRPFTERIQTAGGDTGFTLLTVAVVLSLSLPAAAYRRYGERSRRGQDVGSTTGVMNASGAGRRAGAIG